MLGVEGLGTRLLYSMQVHEMVWDWDCAWNGLGPRLCMKLSGTETRVQIHSEPKSCLPSFHEWGGIDSQDKLLSCPLRWVLVFFVWLVYMYFCLLPCVANGNSDIDPVFCVCVCVCVWCERGWWYFLRVCVCYGVFDERYAPVNFARFRPCAASTVKKKVYSATHVTSLMWPSGLVMWCHMCPNGRVMSCRM